ncbi:MarR family winged helix-turn-helix transcriptional regulator [Nocardia sp. 2YAB30]|uniref:MarR family winged helix-turn-helix transcriptional regulator n=1 Tax=unclassified Nocardia TaxID=2637762 RepID=UPI003F9C27EC
MDSGRALPPSLLDLEIYLLSRIGKAARGRFADRLSTRGLRLWHMAILAALADFGPHAQRDLAERLSIHPSDVAKVVDELESAGQVERARDDSDRRRITVRLTRTGRTALKTLDHEAHEISDEILAPLTRAERTHLTAMLKRLCARAYPDSVAE